MRPSTSVEAKLGRGRAAAGVLAAALSIVASASGCDPSCDISDEGNPPEVYADGIARGGAYETSPWMGPFLHLPGGKQYQLVHHLGFEPSLWNITFGFSANDDRMAPCAGNSCELRCIDDQIIWVKNDTCTDFYLRVTASGPPNPSQTRCSNDHLDAGGSVVEEGASGDEIPPDAMGPDL